MSKLPKFTLSHSEKGERWELRQDKTHKLVKSFETKADATAGGVLARAIGGEGSVKIEKTNGRYRKNELSRAPRTRSARQVESNV